MKNSSTDAAPPVQWTLIRGARQLLTLRGASGPRRWSDMADIGLLTDCSVLIRNGVIERLGSARQIDSTPVARIAREIDAQGMVVIPAFADPDCVLVQPDSAPEGKQPGAETDIRRMSGRRLEAGATSTAADLVRYGVSTLGAHTLFAPDLRHTVRVLRLHTSMQGKPLRIRSVFSPPCCGIDSSEIHRARVTNSWLPSIFERKLASLIEVAASTPHLAEASVLTAAAAACGFNTRFRISGIPTEDLLRLAYSSGAIAIHGMVPENSLITRALADMSCVQVVLASHVLAGQFVPVRAAIDDGMPIAVASGYRRDISASLNPQYSLHLACLQLGLSVEEAIVAATYNAACALRLSHVTGSLEPGKSADLCMVDVDDYRELPRRAGHHDVCLVMRAGRVVYRRPPIMIE